MHLQLIVFNTCAVREHAEQRVFGNVGALKGLKEANPKLLIDRQTKAPADDVSAGAFLPDDGMPFKAAGQVLR